MSCDNAQARVDLDALFTGTLDGEGYARLRQHALSCESCRAEYERRTHVASVLEKRALPQAHQDAMEQELFARLGIARALQPEAANDVADPPGAGIAARERPRGESSGRISRLWSRRAVPAALLAAAVALLLVFIPNRVSRDDRDWQARSGAKGPSFGVRAFCVAAGGRILGESGPDGTLTCGPGASIQFAYTASRPGTLTLDGPTPELRFFPREGGGRVPPGTDVALPFSTPVSAGWLRAPMDVTARWSGDDGSVAISTIRLQPPP